MEAHIASTIKPTPVINISVNNTKKLPLKLQNNITHKAKPTKTTTKHQKPNTQTHQDNTKFLKTSKDPWNLTKMPTLPAQNPGLLRRFMRPKHHNRLRGVAAHREEKTQKKGWAVHSRLQASLWKEKNTNKSVLEAFFGLKNKQKLWWLDWIEPKNFYKIIFLNILSLSDLQIC